MRQAILIILLFFSLVVVHSAWANNFDHREWDELLTKGVYPVDGWKSSQVDYSFFQEKENRQRLKKYLRGLAGVSQEEFDGWPKGDQLAFLINAYNSWTVELILGRYPDVDSIKDLGSFFQSPWKKKFIPLFENKLSLDDIEHGLIRGSGRYNDPRIHFAVNCASIGCPALRFEAYVGENIEQQLEDAVRLFLSDRTRNRLRDNTLEISSIFKWYKEDFEISWRNNQSLEDFLTSYAASLGLSENDTSELQAGRIRIKYLSYDWKLNSYTLN